MDREYIDQLSKDIDDAAKDLKSRFQDLSDNLHHLKRAVYEYDSETQKQHPLIIKRVAKHIADGLTQLDAISQTAIDLKLPLERVEGIFSYQKKYTASLQLYARRYFVHHLKKRGYSSRDIAQIIGISLNSVYRLEKSNCIF